MKQFKLTFVLTMLMSMVGLPAFADWDTSTKVPVDGLFYYLDYDNLQAQVTNNGNGNYTGDKEIPNDISYNGKVYSVTSIGNSAFSWCSDLTSITIGNSVTSIGDQAFSECPKLTSVTIGNSVTSIGNSAFANCTDLTSITIPNSVTTIGDGAFSGCSRLTSITIPNSVTSIGISPFKGCSGLTSLMVESGNTKYDSRDNCNAIIETESNTLVSGCKNTNIPNSVTSIGDQAFSWCKGLTSITIPNSVTSIGRDAFGNCSKLTSIAIPNSVTTIGNNAFSQCFGLTKVIVSDIAAWCGISFYGGASNPLCFAHHLYSDENTEITNLVIPDGVTYIGDWAFWDCSGLTSITIPNSVTSIGNGAFYDCKGLTSVTIGNSVTSIGNSAFANCTDLTSVTLNSNAIVSKAYTSYYNIKNIFGEQVTEYIIGDGVTSIGIGAFGLCTHITSISIPNSVTSIGDSAFWSCSGLTSVTIPNSVTSIDNGAFADCTGLTSVTIPSSVTTIGAIAFSGCSKLTSVTALNPTPVAIKENVFSNRTNATLYVRKGSKEAYQAADYWKEFKEIKNIPLPTHKLIYMVDGEEYKSYDVEEEDPITPEPAPEKEGYTFSGWSEIPATMPAHDVTITGTFAINTYKLTYMVDNEVYKTYDVKYGETITPEPAPTKEGYTFSGWSSIPEKMPAHDVTVTGTFTIDTGIEQILNELNNGAVIYSIDGKRVSELQKGVNIVRMNDGTTRKVVVK